MLPRGPFPRKWFVADVLKGGDTIPEEMTVVSYIHVSSILGENQTAGGGWGGGGERERERERDLRVYGKRIETASTPVGRGNLFLSFCRCFCVYFVLFRFVCLLCSVLLICLNASLVSERPSNL